ncbi:MAG: hypothetical protein Kow0080_31880 [Candidatus Promineifilaceae bacterium]
MSKRFNSQRISRRHFLKVGGGLLAGAAASRFLPRTLGQSGEIVQAAGFSQVNPTPPDLHLAGTDGWIYLPGQVPIPDTANAFYTPDNYAPAPFNTYMFGFRDVTGLTDEQVFAQKMRCQATAPLFWVDENQEYRLKLTNLGLAMRPDLVDDHTVHWHGFRNAWPIFDGEPHSSVSVPISRSLTLFYQPRHPGTYMYHCHFEETEHVHMGMTGSVFVRPAQNGSAYTYNGKTYTKFAYNDGDGSTGYDREYVMTLTDVWAEAHWADSHVQLPDWTEFNPDYYLINGRVYPDTTFANGGDRDLVTGELLPPQDPVTGQLRPELAYQPLGSLIQCNEGDRVLVRLINLTFGKHTMTLQGMNFHVVGKDATHLRGRDGTDFTYHTNSIQTGAGESYDAIFTAPENLTFGPNEEYKTFLFYNRHLSVLTNSGAPGYGGQMTEIRVYPAGTLPAQTKPNDL